MSGIKHDAGKMLPDLVLGDFAIALLHVIYVGTGGAYKYEPKNFQKLENAEERYGEAAGRHYWKRKLGELFDQESGEYHYAHEIWCKIAEFYFFLRDRAVDDDLVLTIQNAEGRYYGYDAEWSNEPTWWDEMPGRQAIWHLIGNDKTFVPKVVKRPAGEVEEIWGRVSPEQEALIQAAIETELPGVQQMCDLLAGGASSLKFENQDGVSTPGYKFEEGPFGVWNTVLDKWYAGTIDGDTSWAAGARYAKEYVYRTDAVVCITDQLGIVDQQVCEIRPLLEIRTDRPKAESVTVPLDHPLMQDGNGKEDTYFRIYDAEVDMWVKELDDQGIVSLDKDPKEARLFTSEGIAQDFITNNLRGGIFYQVR